MKTLFLNPKNFNLFFIFHILKDIKSFDENEMYTMHFNCLKIILKNFSSATFVITVDDFDNPLILELKQKLSILCTDNNSIKEVKFIIEHNNTLCREGIIFKKYVLDKLDSYDENSIYLFGHTKGIYNYNQNYNVSLWVASMYYFCINYADTFIHKLHKETLLSYGFPCFNNCIWMPNLNFIYAGGFQVFCPKLLYKYIIKHNIDINNEINKYMDNERFILELFLPIIIKKEDVETYVGYPEMDKLKKHEMKWPFDIYDNEQYNNFLKTYLSYDLYIKFIDFYNEVTSDLHFLREE